MNNNNNKQLSLYIFLKNVSFSFSLTWYTKLTKTTTEIKTI